MTTATDTTTSNATADTHGLAIVQADPSTLLVDVNTRTDLDLDPDFLASIAEHGVMVPIVAVRTAEGALRVRFGHRRTMAAIKTEQPLVPVVISGDEHDGTDTAVAERIVQQWHENEHRAGLRVADQVGAVAQLAAFGLTAGAIASQLRAPRADVQQALTVAGSKLATKSLPRYDLTLDQAATVADFEDNADTVKALVAAAKKSPGDFAHVAQRARDSRDAEQAKATIVDTLTKAGVRVIEEGDHNPSMKSLTELVADAAGKKITPGGHKNCPGHAARIVTDWRGTTPDAQYVCTDWRANGHRDRYAPTGGSVPAAAKTDAEREKESKQRREVVENNKAWRSAETVRRAWLTQFLARKSAPRGSQQFIATELAHGSHELKQALDSSGDALLHELLGVKDKATRLAMTTKATEARAQVLTLAFILAAYEAQTGVHTWRRKHADVARYFAYLAENGYELSDVERLTQPPAKKPAKAATEKPAVVPATATEAA
ncbi:MAG: ParB/RepB/Spo0J family partition protein [Jatrophihabitans sp.]